MKGMAMNVNQFTDEAIRSAYMLDLCETFNRLRDLRKARGWTQAECAKRIGVGYHALRSWEGGLRSPKPIVHKAIQEFVKRHTPKAA